MRKGWNYINFVFWMGIWYNSLLFIFFPPNEVFPLVLDFITVIWDIMRWPICINPTFRLYVPTQSGPWNWKFTWLILLWNILFLIIDDSWLNVCLSWKTIILRIIWFLSSLLEFINVSDFGITLSAIYNESKIWISYAWDRLCEWKICSW